MDNITHTLIGAVLGQAGLKRKTGLAMPALMIAANLPDIDAPCVFYGVEALAMRRGLTHGPLALLVLPLALTGALVWYDRWQARRGKRPAERLPVNGLWLWALCVLGMLSHLLFDWLNSYGIRLLEPFSAQWYYGDALFIIDPWLWATLVAGIWLSRRAARHARTDWSRPAVIAVVAILGYTALNIGISRLATMRVLGDAPYPQVAVANPVALTFWQRDVLWRGADGNYGTVTCSPLGCVRPSADVRQTRMADPRIAERARNDPAAQAFLFWSRLPIARIDGERITLKDQRFSGAAGRGNFNVELKPQ